MLKTRAYHEVREVHVDKEVQEVYISLKVREDQVECLIQEHQKSRESENRSRDQIDIVVKKRKKK